VRERGRGGISPHLVAEADALQPDRLVRLADFTGDADPPGRYGIASLTAAMLTEGALSSP